MAFVYLPKKEAWINLAAVAWVRKGENYVENQKVACLNIWFVGEDEQASKLTDPVDIHILTSALSVHRAG
jgi:hypothetical protein